MPTPPRPRHADAMHTCALLATLLIVSGCSATDPAQERIEVDEQTSIHIDSGATRASTESPDGALALPPGARALSGDPSDEHSLCGNGVVDPGEECDLGPDGDPHECRKDCIVPRCGNSVLDPYEECDDGNRRDHDGCNRYCLLPFCGDGVLDPGEECDDRNTRSGDGCQADCLLPVCGDGVLDDGEQCDDGNDDNVDECRNSCAVPSCGDGVLDEGEQCDDGNDVDGDGCQSDCSDPVCGDGIVDDGEDCDDGNENDEDGCRIDCSAPRCGDGIPDAGEECDDGNIDNTDACRDDCTQPLCGDGIMDAGEDCDDGDTDNGDECRNDCSLPRCGDGILDYGYGYGEQCDDGNSDDADDCRNNCTVPRCGDGIADLGEQCDDGNTNDADGCRNDCTAPLCGDGMVDDGEQCDDGDEDDADECRNDCTEPVCGDGIVDDGEECDAGDDGGASECRSDCTIPECGDGIMDDGEECDDGNEDPFDGCSAECTTEAPCDLQIDKRCRVIDDRPEGSTCEGKIVSLKLEYTGEGCGATTNDQGGKASCEGGADGRSPVSIVATDKKGKRTWLSAGEVEVGQQVTIDAAAGGADKLDADTIVEIGGGLEVVGLHTSCSKPITLGDQFGSLKLIELTSTEGGTVSVAPEEGADECSIASGTAGTQCDGKLASLSLRYVGGSCADSSHDQSGKLRCEGDVDTAQPVRIVATEKADGRGATYLDQDGVVPDQEVTLSAATDGKKKKKKKKELKADTHLSVFDVSGRLLQTLTIHTSCSKPLGLGDRFGAFEVVGFSGKKGSAKLGANVEYTYAVTNPNATEVVVDVVDDKLGIIATDVTLAAGETVTFSQSARIAEATTNVATVYGGASAGLACEAAEDTVVVSVPQPPAADSCDDGKPVAVVFEYTGLECSASTNDQEGKFECSGTLGDAATVGVSVLKDANKVLVSSDSLERGQLLTVRSSDGKKLKAETVLELQGASGTQELNIHTSCSKPLRVGDQFGALLLRSIEVER